jgi:hypothetical protein
MKKITNALKRIAPEVYELKKNRSTYIKINEVIYVNIINNEEFRVIVSLVGDIGEKLIDLGDLIAYLNWKKKDFRNGKIAYYVKPEKKKRGIK